MRVPEKIYLQTCGDCPKVDCENCKFEDLVDNVTWCRDRIFKSDKIYISKEALLDWLKRKQKELYKSEPTNMALGMDEAFDMVIKRLNR